MKPQFVRLVVSPNNNVQCSIPTRTTFKVQSASASTPIRTSLSSIQVLQGLSQKPAAALPTRIILTSPSASYNPSNQSMSQAFNGPQTQSSIYPTTSTVSLNSSQTDQCKTNESPHFAVFFCPWDYFSFHLCTIYLFRSPSHSSLQRICVASLESETYSTDPSRTTINSEEENESKNQGRGR